MDIVISLNDGGLMSGGYTSSSQTGLVGKNHGDFDGWVVKLNSNQDTVYTRVMGGTGTDFFITGTAASDGGFVFAGYSNAANGDVTGTLAGGSDWWIVKLNSKGDTVWTRLMGGAFTDIPNSIANTADGGFIVAGYRSSGSSSTTRDGYVVKLNSNGNIVWQQTLGGTAPDIINAVSVASDGTILLAGFSSSTTTGNNHGSADMWVVKLKEDGTVVYSKLFGGTEGDQANAVSATTDGGCIVAGFTGSNKTGDVGANKGSQDVWVLKLNGNGDTTFTKMLGGSANERAFTVAPTTDGGYLVAGHTNSTDGDIVNNHGDNDIWSFKLNKSGQLLWRKTFGGSGYEFAGKMAIGTNNSIYVAGYTESNSTGDVGASFGSGDAWIFKFKRHP